MYLYPANIILPDFSRVDGTKWATVACDQYTSEPEYWEAVKQRVADAPSAFNLILPEVWLEDSAARIPTVHAAMDKYLEADWFCDHANCGIYLERRLSGGKIRRGIVACIDLEDYDYSAGSVSAIRATEKTVVERIPPRLEVRRDAALELPHILLLVDDIEDKILGPFAGRAADAYDFLLDGNAGAVRGAFIKEDEFVAINAAIDEAVKNRGSKKAPIVFAVGDGNHSLATAKAAYEEIKAKIGADAAADHPARYALCELGNLHDASLEFEPIYRIVDAENVHALVDDFRNLAAGLDGECPAQSFTVIVEGKSETITVNKPELTLAVATLQKFLDEYTAAHPNTVTDYIHGEDTLCRLAEKKGSVGFIFDGIRKSELFPAVENDGALPRKTFSMGHAADKRYYIECRKIK